MLKDHKDQVAGTFQSPDSAVCGNCYMERNFLIVPAYVMEDTDHMSICVYIVIIAWEIAWRDPFQFVHQKKVFCSGAFGKWDV